jgi:NAD(P)-dependent dehydrogenase (short-subunit alcohol dehydrogenase family)
MKRDYSDKTVVITGAAGGLGQALCRRFSDAGAKVAALDFNGPAVEAFAGQLTREGRHAIALACDVTDMAACTSAVDRIAAHYGAIDILINNAGVSHFSLVKDTDVSVIRRVMDVNFFGSVHCTQAALPRLIESRGQIVVISSIAGFSPLYERCGYSASKHALHGFFDTLRTEVEDQGVDVTVVCPSFVATGIGVRALGADGHSGMHRKTVGRETSPAEMADLIYRDCAANRRLSLPTPLARLSWWVSSLAPQFFAKQMKRRMAPGTPSTPASTG